MLPKVTLISATNVDWNKFVTVANDALGRSPTRELDNCSVPVGLPPTYISALAEFNRAGSNPITSVRDADRLLHHISLTFLVSCDRDVLMAVLKQSIGLVVLSAEPSRGQENAIITATLRDWKTAILESSSPSAETWSRVIFNDIWKALVTLGFKDLFSAYQRREMKDHTFALEKAISRR